MWYKNTAGKFFELVTKHACDGQTDGQTDRQNYDSQDRASIASRCKNGMSCRVLAVYMHVVSTTAIWHVVYKRCTWTVSIQESTVPAGNHTASHHSLASLFILLHAVTMINRRVSILWRCDAITSLCHGNIARVMNTEAAYTVYRQVYTL